MALLTSDRKPRSLLQSAELFSYIVISCARAEDARGRYVPEKKIEFIFKLGRFPRRPEKKRDKQNDKTVKGKHGIVLQES